MKRCPKCSTDYFDNMLDFCLDDGERLLLLRQRKEAFKEISSTQAETAVYDNNFHPAVFVPLDTKTDLQIDLQDDLQNKTEGIKQKVTSQWLKTLEIVPIFLALAHNYWQWLYLARKSYYDFSSFFLSADFLIWLFLLITGAVFGIISLKYSKRKGFAVTALVVLAINVILSIVPK
jgi:hypothetical protein